MTALTISPHLAGRRVLITEDEFFIADDLAVALHKVGAEVIGPAPTVSRAMTLLDERAVDFALLDINLQGEKVFALADRLVASGIPFVFATGYDQSIIPDRFGHIRRCQKPFDAAALVAAITASGQAAPLPQGNSRAQ